MNIVSYLYTGPPLTPTKNGKPAPATAPATLGAYRGQMVTRGRRALRGLGALPMATVRDLGLPARFGTSMPAFRRPTGLTPISQPSAFGPKYPVSVPISPTPIQLQLTNGAQPATQTVLPPTSVDQVQDGMNRRRWRRGQTQTSTSTPYGPSTVCTIDQTGARVCSEANAGAFPPGAQPAGSTIAPPTSSCVNVDPTTGVCLDSQILAAQQAGITTAAAPCVTDPTTGLCTAPATTVGGIDLTTVPSYVWYILFGGVVYFLFFKKK